MNYEELMANLSKLKAAGAELAKVDTSKMTAAALKAHQDQVRQNRRQCVQADDEFINLSHSHGRQNAKPDFNSE